MAKLSEISTIISFPSILLFGYMATILDLPKMFMLTIFAQLVLGFFMTRTINEAGDSMIFYAVFIIQ